MTTPETFADIDIAAIEREARQMRARVIADSIRAMVSWMTGRRRTAAVPHRA